MGDWFVPLDFEARSKADIRKLGGRRYCDHPSTEPICLVADVDGVEVVWDFTMGPDCPDVLVNAVDRGGVLVAHNAVGFDRHMWESLLGWPRPVRWGDTAQWARVAGYPKASLDFLGKRLLGVDKDAEGSKLTKELSKVWPKNAKSGVPGEFKLAAIPADKLVRTVDYCRIDVRILKGLVPILSPFDEIDRAFREADLAVIDRGLPFDRALAAAVIDCSELLAINAQDVAGVTADEVRSRVQFLASLAEEGLDLPNAQKLTLQAALDEGDLSEHAQALIEARLGTNTIAAGKLRAGLLQCSDDGWLRDQLQYYGAHTGRESGKGLQPQNLPK